MKGVVELGSQIQRDSVGSDKLGSVQEKFLTVSVITVFAVKK